MHPLDTVSHIAARASRLLAAIAMATALYACAGAPVQEMSNARQTLAAAEQAQSQAETGKASPQDLANARRFLDAAQAALDAGDYSTAREDALKAQQIALRVLAMSQGQDVSGHTPA